MKRWIVCSLAAAITAQIWGTISWMALPWHNMDFRQFTNEVAVTEAIRPELNGSGIYTLPNMDPKAHESEDGMKEWNAKAEKGPFAFISVRADGIESGMGFPMAVGFLVNWLIAIALFWLVRNSSITCPKGRTFFIAVAGSIGGLYPILSNWAWWRFPPIYSFVGAIDLFITWGLAGLVMVKLMDQLGREKVS